MVYLGQSKSYCNWHYFSFCNPIVFLYVYYLYVTFSGNPLAMSHPMSFEQKYTIKSNNDLKLWSISKRFSFWSGSFAKNSRGVIATSQIAENRFCSSSSSTLRSNKRACTIIHHFKNTDIHTLWVQFILEKWNYLILVVCIFVVVILEVK